MPWHTQCRSNVSSYARHSRSRVHESKGNMRFSSARRTVAKKRQLRHDQRGVLLFHQMWDQAIRDFSEILRCRPDDIHGRFSRGMALFKSGQIEDAHLDFSKVLELNPHHVMARYARYEGKKHSHKRVCAFMAWSVFGRLISCAVSHCVVRGATIPRASSKKQSRSTRLRCSMTKKRTKMGSEETSIDLGDRKVARDWSANKLATLQQLLCRILESVTNLLCLWHEIAMQALGKATHTVKQQQQSVEQSVKTVQSTPQNRKSSASFEWFTPRIEHRERSSRCE